MRLTDKEFASRHKLHMSDFTRIRKLDFVSVFLLILRSSVKSLQNVLNEFVLHLKLQYTITSSAFTQARKKLSHTAFIELNDHTVSFYFRDDDIRRLRGFRCLGVDSSLVILPNTKEIREAFGTVSINRGDGKDLGCYAAAKFQCCYDVLNRIAVKTSFSPGKGYEVDLAIEMLPNLTSRDLLIFDRGYASYKMLASLVKAGVSYVVRCPRNSFKVTESLFAGKGPNSIVATLAAHKSQKKYLEKLGLPNNILVRFVSVLLSTGEIEVLATSLMDTKETTFTPDFFKEVYCLRWGVESFFGIIKGRLALENFTGKTVESVKQDFWSAILISNMETIMTEDIERELNEDLEDNQPIKKINKSVSFNALKNMAFELFYEKDTDYAVDQLTKLFSMNTLTQRKHRVVPRREASAKRSLNFHKRIKKQVF